MSNDLLKEEFFNNPNIPDCEKLGLFSLIGCGSYETQMDSVGRESSFVSMCPRLTGGTQFIAFTFGRPESLNKMAVNTMLHSIGVKGDMVDRIFSSMSDEEVIKESLKMFRTARKTTPAKDGEIYESLQKQNIKNYGGKLKMYNAYIANHPQVFTNAVDLLEKEVGSAKAQAQAKPQESATEEDVKKND